MVGFTWRGNHMQEKPASHTSDNYPVSQSYIYQTPPVHDSPATRTQSSIESLVPQTRFGVVISMEEVYKS